MKPTTETAEHAGPTLDRKGEFEVIDCEACGFRHVLPLPTPEELEATYDEEYYSTEKPLYLDEARRDLDWWRIVYRERLAALDGALGARATRRLLDVGSGPGFFLAEAKAHGWQTLGIEPSRQAAAHSRDELGLEIVETFLDDRSAPEFGRFDAVHLCNVLEHVPDPRGLLATAASLLEPGGVLLAIAPNDYNPLQRALREADGFEPWWVAPPHHLNYFDMDSLPLLTEAIGLEVLDRTGTFPMELFLLGGENYVGNGSLGRTCHGRRMRLEQTLEKAGMGELRADLYRSLADLGIGREVQVLARKRDRA
ncbi:MAG TPA: class I SAM-dependent methyltransferase [Planctomycetes bacterium]|nr:class I SAM-dependent methyltransferase [Planctomycetota bacterium]